MSESIGQYPELEYNWQEPNPSSEIGLPVLLSVVFDGECAWMAKRSYDNEEMFVVTEDLYRVRYPNLFEEIEARISAKAETGSFEDANVIMRHYYRGAVIAIRSIEASIGDDYVPDLSSGYLEKIGTLDMIEWESWILTMRAFTSRHTEQMRGFIKGNYELLNEPRYAKTAMLIGAEYTYTLLAHSRACIEREKEIAWDMYRTNLADQAYEAFIRGEEELQHYYLG